MKVDKKTAITNLVGAILGFVSAFFLGGCVITIDDEPVISIISEDMAINTNVEAMEYK